MERLDHRLQTHKRCNGPCGQTKPVDEFPWRHKAKGYRFSLCRPCAASKNAEYRAQPGYRDTKRKKYARVRLEVLAMLGGRCTCCGETEPVFLALDHIDGLGDHERLTGLDLYYRIRRDPEYRALFQVLCHNCNHAKEQGGCPHQRVELKAVI